MPLTRLLLTSSKTVDGWLADLQARIAWWAELDTIIPDGVGEDVAAEVASRAPDAVLVDMDQMNWSTVLRSIRKADRSRRIIAIATASTEEAWRNAQVAHEAGAVCFIPKRTDVRTFSKLLRSALKRQAEQRNTSENDLRPALPGLDVPGSAMEANMIARTVLIAENNDAQRNSLSDLLRARGYQTRLAASPEEALRILKSEWVHAAIVDLRLHDDTDAKDFSGFIEVIEGSDPVVPKILWSLYPTWELLNDALGPRAGGGAPPAAAFVYKGDGDEPLLDKLNFVMAGLNLDLKVEEAGAFSFVGLATALSDARRQDDLLLKHAKELRDLYRKISIRGQANGQDEINVRWLHYGHTLPALTTVQRRSDLGTQNNFVVQCGQRSEVGAVWRNLQAYFSPYLEGHAAHADAFAETLHFAAIRYQLDGQAEDYDLLSDIVRLASPELLDRVVAVIGRTFTELCAKWYEGAEVPLADSVENLYRRALRLEEYHERFARQFSQLLESHPLRKALRQPGQYAFQLIGEEPVMLQDPLPMIFGSVEARLETTGLASKETVTHGNLTPEQILVGPANQLWLLASPSSGIGFGLRDFCSLEAALVFGASRTAEPSEVARALRAWLSPDSLDESFPGDHPHSPELLKAFALSGSIRRAARQCTGVDDARHYYIGLLFEAVRCVFEATGLTADRSSPRYGAAALAIVLIADRIATWREWRLTLRPAQAEVIVSKNDWSVIVCGKLISLTEKEYELLQLLAERPYVICPRRMIVERMWPKDEEIHGDQSLTTLVKRVREKIEPESGVEQYIITHKGQGYEFRPNR